MRNTTIIMALACAVALTGCDKQRDLYVTAGPLIYAQGNWNPALGREDMSMDATAVAYNEAGLAVKEYFFAPTTVTLPIDAGTYDIMLFNGLMYSPENTHLDNVFFRGTERIDTFEAVAREGTLIERLGSRAEGDVEYIASNGMEIITSDVKRQQVDASHAYYIKYKDGKNGFETPKDYIDAELSMTPVAMSYESQIVVTIENISSAAGANAALYGFVGSAYMASREPSHFFVSHHFNLNNKRMRSGGNVGTIESPVFVTFGPPVDMPDNVCEVFMKILLWDGTYFEQTYDVTDQVAPVLEVIKANLAGEEPTQYGMKIPIEISLKLPLVDPIEGGIGLGEWVDEELIRVPIPKKP